MNQSTNTVEKKYAPLTREQKRRKQEIRNWKRMQKELVDSYKVAKVCLEKELEFYNNFAIRCALITKQDQYLQHRVIIDNNFKIFNELFTYDDAQHDALYNMQMQAEQLVASFE